MSNEDSTVKPNVGPCPVTSPDSSSRPMTHQSQPATSEGNHTQASGLTSSRPKPLQPAAFHGIVGDFVKAMIPNTEADPAAMLIQFLIWFGTIVNRRSFASVGATRHHLNENVAIVGPTNSGRKGGGGDIVEEFFRRVGEREPKARVESQSGLSTGEGLISAVRDPVRRAKRDEVPDPGVADKRLLARESELASLLKVAQREGNTLSPTIRNAWDGKTLQTMSKGTPMKATDAHISIVGHITIEELRRELGQTDMVNGFANRFLYCYSERTHLLPDGGEFPAVEIEPLVIHVAEIVEVLARCDNELTRDDEARQLWHSVYPKLTRDVPGLFGAAIARGAAHVLRLSCLYALLDEEPEVHAVHLRAALAVWKYCEDSARHIFGDATGMPLADTILRALRMHPQGLTRSDLTRDVLQGNKSAGQIGQAFALLADSGLAHYRMEPTDGRPAERWFAADVADQQAA